MNIYCLRITCIHMSVVLLVYIPMWNIHTNACWTRLKYNVFVLFSTHIEVHCWQLSIRLIFVLTFHYSGNYNSFSKVRILETRSYSQMYSFLFLVTLVANVFLKFALLCSNRRRHNRRGTLPYLSCLHVIILFKVNMSCFYENMKRLHIGMYGKFKSDYILWRNSVTVTLIMLRPSLVKSEKNKITLQCFILDIFLKHLRGLK